MTILLTTIFFVLGLIVGSFLNVAILRLNTERSFGGRSACMTCQNTLCWYELIPVFSFIALRGRCRNCKVKISTQYPIVEILTGIIFAALFLKFENFFLVDTLNFTLLYAFYAAAFSLLLVIAVYDLRHKIIPDSLSLFLAALGLANIFLFSINGFYPHLPSLLEFSSGFLVALPFAFFWLVSKGTWMGLGDAKLAIGLGWLLGLSRAISGIVLAFWIGAVAGLAMIAFSRRYGMKSEVPFAPYLVLGAILAFLFELHLFY